VNEHYISHHTALAYDHASCSHLFIVTIVIPSHNALSQGTHPEQLSLSLGPVLRHWLTLEAADFVSLLFGFCLMLVCAVLPFSLSFNSSPTSFAVLTVVFHPSRKALNAIFQHTIAK